LLLTAVTLSAANPSTARIRRVRPLESGVRIELDRRVEPRLYTLLHPSRLVIDFEHVLHPGAGGRWPGRGDAFSSVRSGQFEGGVTPVARVVLDLEANVTYRSFWNGSHLTVLLERDIELDLRDALAPLAPAMFVSRPKPARFPSRRALVRRFRGELRDRSGKPLSGNYLLRFSSRDWSESIYVKARRGRFVARLGQHNPLPERYREAPLKVEAAGPPGTGWRISSK
jgi:hypothetical protein